MRLTVPTPPLNPAKSFSFRRAHLPSTCSKVTPTAAISSAPSFKPCLNEKEVQNAKTAQIQTKETPRHCRAPKAFGAAHRSDRSRVRRFGRTKHETLARVV